MKVLETRPPGPRQAVPYPYLQHGGSPDRPTATRGGGSRPDDGLLWVQPPLLIDFTTLSHKPNPHKRETTPPPPLLPINHQRSIRPTAAAPFPDTLLSSGSYWASSTFSPLLLPGPPFWISAFFHCTKLQLEPGPQPDKPQTERKQRQKRGNDTSNKAETEVQDSTLATGFNICAFKRTIDSNPRIQ